ncbi:hypothetical protein [Pseudoroseomonas sp. WGS1072]|uniref:hypothetical protein n=1 Tax=Roseomonas sp. WGS1072 TaxID=3366816 RepID=UPI003BEFF5BF
MRCGEELCGAIDQLARLLLVAAQQAQRKAAVAAKNECELVVLLAEARIGTELRAAQERGEVAGKGNPTGANQHGGNVRGSDISSATLQGILHLSREHLRREREERGGERQLRAVRPEDQMRGRDEALEG